MAGMTLTELNKQALEAEVEIDPKNAEIVDEDPVIISSEEQACMDVREAIRLLSQASIVMSYIGDPEVCKVVTKRERKALRAMNKRVIEFLDEAVPYYMEEGEV